MKAKYSLPLNSAVEGGTNEVASRPVAKRDTVNNFGTPRRDRLPHSRFGGGRAPAVQS